MGFLGLKWFRSEKDKELEQLKVEEQKIKNELLKKALTPPVEPTNNKPYKQVRLIVDTLTVTLNDGSILTKAESGVNDFNKVKAATTETEVISIVSSYEGRKEADKAQKEFIEAKLTIEGIETLKKSKDFLVEGDTAYMRGSDGTVIKRSLPQLLIKQFARVISNQSAEYESLKKFWLKCCLNPNAQSAEDLYGFLSRHHFKIDRHGNFYAYRRVVSTQSANKELVEFVSNAYNKVKAIWKKKPSDFEIWRKSPFDSGDFILHRIGTSFDEDESYTLYGNLEKLYLDLPNMQEKAYTSAHTGKEDYRVGEVISMPRNEGNDSNQVSCSRGFHAASRAYDYSGFGDSPILVIINPMDVLAVPVGEVGKLRTCRWFFAMVLDESEKYILDEDDFDVTDLGDVFEEKCNINLEEYVKNGFTEEIKRHTFTMPVLTSSDVTNIVRSLDVMKKAIAKRVVQYEQ